MPIREHLWAMVRSVFSHAPYFFLAKDAQVDQVFGASHLSGIDGATRDDDALALCRADDLSRACDPVPPPLARLSRLLAREVEPGDAAEDEFEPDSGAGEGRDHAAFEGEGQSRREGRVEGDQGWGEGGGGSDREGDVGEGGEGEGRDGEERRLGRVQVRGRVGLCTCTREGGVSE